MRPSTCFHRLEPGQLFVEHTAKGPKPPPARAAAALQQQVKRT
jgi:hypothetical protein